MPETETIRRADQDRRQGKAPSTQAGEFVREEFHHIREGKHGARSAKQAIAIGLSKARRAGVPLAPPRKGKTSAAVRHHAEGDYQKGQRGGAKVSAARSTATLKTLKKEGHASGSTVAISRQSHQAAMKRTKASRSAAVRRGASARLAM